jgi:hypothetical protein
MKTLDNFADSWGNMTIDLGFELAPQGFALADRDRNGAITTVLTTVDVAPVTTPQTTTTPATFARWQLDHPGTAESDTDDDSASNLLEYAMGSDVSSGASQPIFKLTSDTATGRVDMVITRPTGGRADIRYILSAKADARNTAWARLSLAPEITQNNDGTENVRYANIASATVFAGSNLGLVRLETQLDANLDGTPEATSYSTTQVWIRRSISERMTFSMPLLKADLFRGRITSTLGNRLRSGSQVWTTLLTADRLFYIEVTSGVYEGHRFDLDASATTSTDLVIEGSLPAGLIGATFALRSHWTVDELFPTTLFKAGPNADEADRLLFFDGKTNAFRSSWLANDGWTGSVVGTNILAPGEGLIVHARTSAVTLTLTGSLRSNQFHLPLKAGAQLVGSGFPMDHSPVSLGLTTTNGFTSGTRASSADRLRLWEGDTTEGAATYRSLFLQQRSTGSIWIQENDAGQLDQSRAVLLAPSQALFLLPKTALPDFREP